MSLVPLLSAPPVIQVHAWLALGAFGLGMFQMLGPKGTTAHRAVGWIWVLLLGAVAASSFWIHTFRIIGPFSPIHGLSAVTLVMLPLAVLAARRGDVAGHAQRMRWLFFGAMLIAGAFTLWPGRLMHAVVFGG